MGTALSPLLIDLIARIGKLSARREAILRQYPQLLLLLTRLAPLQRARGLTSRLLNLKKPRLSPDMQTREIAGAPLYVPEWTEAVKSDRSSPSFLAKPENQLQRSSLPRSAFMLQTSLASRVWQSIGRTLRTARLDANSVRKVSFANKQATPKNEPSLIGSNPDRVIRNDGNENPNGGSDNRAHLDLGSEAQEGSRTFPFSVGHIFHGTFASVPLLVKSFLPFDSMSRSRTGVLSNDSRNLQSPAGAATETGASTPLGQSPPTNSAFDAEYPSVGRAVMAMHHRWVSTVLLSGSGSEIGRGGFLAGLPLQAARDSTAINRNTRHEHSSIAGAGKDDRALPSQDGQLSTDRGLEMSVPDRMNSSVHISRFPSGIYLLNRAIALETLSREPRAFHSAAAQSQSHHQGFSVATPAPPVAAGRFLQRSSRLVTTFAELEASETKLQLGSMSPRPSTLPRVELPRMQAGEENSDFVSFMQEAHRGLGVPEKAELPILRLPELTSPPEDSEFVSLSDSNYLRLKIARILEEEARRYLPDE